MKKLMISSLFLLSTVSTIFYAQEKKSVKTVSMPTTIKIKDFIDSLTVEELLTILSVGKLKQLTDRPHIAYRLQELQEQINDAFDTLFATQLAGYNLSQEAYENIKYAFQQKTVLMLYTLVYQQTKNLIDPEEDTVEQVLLNFQLTPEELQNYLDSKNKV